MRGAGASRDRHSAPSSEAGWKHLVTGRSILCRVEDTHPIALGYSFCLSCLLFPSTVQEGVQKRSCIRIGPRGQSGSYLKPAGLSFGLGVWEKEQEPASMHIPCCLHSAQRSRACSSSTATQRLLCPGPCYNGSWKNVEVTAQALP